MVDWKFHFRQGLIIVAGLNVFDWKNCLVLVLKTGKVFLFLKSIGSLFQRVMAMIMSYDQSLIDNGKSVFILTERGNLSLLYR